MELKWLLATICLVGLFATPMTPVVFATTAGDGRLPGTTEAMLKADFWVGKLASPHQPILSPAGIGEFNRTIAAAMPQAVVELDRFPDSVDRATLRRWLSTDRLPRGEERYDDGTLLTVAFYDQLEQNMIFRQYVNKTRLAGALPSVGPACAHFRPNGPPVKMMNRMISTCFRKPPSILPSPWRCCIGARIRNGYLFSFIIIVAGSRRRMSPRLPPGQPGRRGGK